MCFFVFFLTAPLVLFLASSAFANVKIYVFRLSAFFSPKQKKIVCANDRLKNVCMGMCKQGRKDWVSKNVGPAQGKQKLREKRL